MSQLERDTIIQRNVARAIAKGQLEDLVEAMHQGRNLTVYASNLITYVESADLDSEVMGYYIDMIRRLSKSAMASYESAGLGIDLDPIKFGGAQ